MLSAGEAVAVVEAAYGLDQSDDEWMRSVSGAFAAALDHGLGGATYCFETREGSLSFRDAAHASAPAAGVSRARELSEALRALCFSSAPRFALASEEAIPVSEARWLAGVSSAQASMRDALMLLASGGPGSGWIVAAATSRSMRVSAQQRERWRRVAAQIAAAGRLRSALASLHVESKLELPFPSECSSEAELSINPVQSARARLRAAVRASTQGERRRFDSAANEVRIAWQALADGCWSIVDQYEADGRRLVVVQRNAANAPDPRALTERERDVAQLAAHGRTGKSIAYELRLGTTTVSQLLHNAARKLGMKGVAELSATIRALAAPEKKGTIETNN